MSIEDEVPTEVHVEPADEDDWEECPCCGTERWLRAIAAYARGACVVTYCAGCGKPVAEEWNFLP